MKLLIASILYGMLFASIVWIAVVRIGRLMPLVYQPVNGLSIVGGLVLGAIIVLTLIAWRIAR